MSITELHAIAHGTWHRVLAGVARAAAEAGEFGRCRCAGWRRLATNEARVPVSGLVRGGHGGSVGSGGRLCAAAAAAAQPSDLAFDGVPTHCSQTRATHYTRSGTEQK